MLPIPPVRLGLSALFSIALIAPLPAQEQLGMRLERTSGMYGAAINPANTAFTPHPWEITLVNADLFAGNNAGFFKDVSLQDLLRNADKVQLSTDISPEKPLAPDGILLDYYRGRNRLFAVGQARVGGPGFLAHLGENHTIGLTSAIRAAATAFGLPSALGPEGLINRKRFKPVVTDRFKASALAWAEIGLHYNFRNFSDNERLWSFGISPKLVLGYEGAYAATSGTFSFVQLNGDTLNFTSPTWSYGLTNGNLHADTQPFRLRVNGMGVAADIGFAIAAPLEDADKEGDYQWRMGVSLLDLGFARLGKNAETHRIQLDTVVQITGADFPKTDDAEVLIQQASQAFLGSPTASKQNDAFAVGLPTALSAQLDYRVAPLLYASAVWVQGIPLGNVRIRRSSTLAVVPRLEHRWFSLSLPVVWSNYQFLRMGMAARFGYLTVGTDYLGSFFQRPALTGADFYVGLKVNGFQFGDGNKRTSRPKTGGTSRRNWRKIKCYEF